MTSTPGHGFTLAMALTNQERTYATADIWGAETWIGGNWEEGDLLAAVSVTATTSSASIA